MLRGDAAPAARVPVLLDPDSPQRLPGYCFKYPKCIYCMRAPIYYHPFTRLVLSDMLSVLVFLFFSALGVTQSLAKLLCVLVLEKSGRPSQNPALCLKLLFTNGSYDLHTLLEASFHFFGEWCHSKTLQLAEGLQDEPLLHLFGSINVLLAKVGRSAGPPLRAYGDKLLKLALTQLKVTVRINRISGFTLKGWMERLSNDPFIRLSRLCYYFLYLPTLLSSNKSLPLSNPPPLKLHLYTGGSKRPPCHSARVLGSAFDHCRVSSARTPSCASPRFPSPRRPRSHCWQSRHDGA